MAANVGYGKHKDMIKFYCMKKSFCRPSFVLCKLFHIPKELKVSIKSPNLSSKLLKNFIVILLRDILQKRENCSFQSAHEMTGKFNLV